ncbi:HepT-like ribonuclease domain-containing protein [Leptolyngbya sp. KIOST-1]|uniref:HepT-like ribonuclease domain-containing protein n=1 Tax=Leptolyngbya sp. KIOST-1 TaxID=1229172 RepID=UPI000907918E
MRGDALYLSNILECINQIELYISDDREAFMRNRMIQDAVIRNFEVMGEAVKRLSEELRNSNPDIP